MNYYQNNIEKVRSIIDELYSCVNEVGAYSVLAVEIEKACANLNNAVNEYEKQVCEKED